MTTILNVVPRYSGELKTQKQIKEFNEFYDLEESRQNHERDMEIEWEREELTRLILTGKGEYYAMRPL